MIGRHIAVVHVPICFDALELSVKLGNLAKSKRSSSMPSIHPNAAGIDIGSRNRCRRHQQHMRMYRLLLKCLTEDHLEGLEDGIIKISKEKFDNISEVSIEAKIAALANYPYLKSRFLPVQIVD